jgi:SprT protein
MHTSLILGQIDDKTQQHKLQLMEVLIRYMPPRAVMYCSELIMLHKLHLHIEVERKDRLGDYSPHLGKGNRISINHNLNPYDFLITFIHELAHHVTYKKYGPHHQSHGKEWKEEFKTCMRPLLQLRMFPPDIAAPLIAHMKKPMYTHSGDVGLMKALMKYDKIAKTISEEIATNSYFTLKPKSKTIYQKKEKLRTYYLCIDVMSGKKMKVHALAHIYQVTDDAAKINS